MSRPSVHPRLAHLASAVALIAVAGSPAGAQLVVDAGLDVQHFEPGAGKSDLLNVRGSDVGPHLGWHVGAIWHLAHEPLVLVRDDTGARIALVEDIHTIDLLGSFSLLDRLEIGLALPIVVSQAGVTSPLVQLAGGGDASGAGLGDLRLTARIQLVGNGPGFRLALAADLSVPTGDEARFQGEDGLTATPALVAGYALDSGLRFEVNVGYRLRPTSSILNVDLGDELTWGVGAEVPFDVGSHRIALLGTLVGAVNLDEAEQVGRPIEALGAVSWRPVEGFAMFAGGGGGLTSGYGAAVWRVLAGVRVNHTSDVREEAPRCELGAEDFDGWQDDDACADPDNDGDGVPDDDDVCPFEAETRNGWRDDDGCPDVRQPGDGPAEPGAGPGEGPDPAWPEEDPTADDDGDGVPNAEDLCPNDAEDPDGFDDADGCPDPDNDGDGILDGSDACPLAAEVLNGVDDEDGCPDVGQVAIEGDRVVILDKVYFASGKDVIQSRSFKLLDQVASVLNTATQLTRVRVEGHTDNVGVAARNLALSQRRASAVLEYLVGQGVERGRLVAEGYGQERPIADNRASKGRAANRRVEFRILEVNGKPVGPADAGTD